ncbi:MAG: hypothetical protein BRC32_03625 [Actinobacteria bacterium QS_8_72_14]|nr:MAG: hypothetical protein BRC32_03625 [Actinobacteria bacterium QS_8_72_14]
MGVRRCDGGCGRQATHHFRDTDLFLCAQCAPTDQGPWGDQFAALSDDEVEAARQIPEPVST